MHGLRIGLGVECTGTKLQVLNSGNDRVRNVASRTDSIKAINLDRWRSIDYESRLNSEIKRIENSEIGEENKKLILQYMNYRLANGVSIARVQRELISLRLLCERYGLDLGRFDETSLNSVLAKLNISGLSLSTINEFKLALKGFLKFIGREDLAKKIKRREPKDNMLTREDLLSVDEVLKLVSAAMNNRDPAMIMCHLDLACRPEELLTLRVGDFVRDSLGIRVELRMSKTFRRAPHLSFSLPYVSRWLNVHPLKDDPNAPMWLDMNKFKQGIVAPIDHFAYTRVIGRLMERAGIKKKFSPYKFRHTGITLWAVLLTEQQLSKRSGHIPGSRYLRRYAKLVDADADKKILKELGLIKEEKGEPEVKKLQPVVCGVCGEFNEPQRDRCWKCKASLDPLKLVKEFDSAEVVEAVIDNDLEKLIEEKVKKMILEVLREEGKI
ncbi:MAG: tyrosine-type recombinase/integrase [Archaeoglobaceae archaeon]